MLGLAPLPPGITLSLTERSILMASEGDVISTAVICPGYAFDTFGIGGPRLSPDQHWVLVDILGPFAPASVPRNHALVNVRSGAVIAAPDFPTVLAIPAAPDGLAWVSGERSTLRYGSGKTVTLRDPIARVVPAAPCAAPGTRPRGLTATGADGTVADPGRHASESAKEARVGTPPRRI